MAGITEVMPLLDTGKALMIGEAILLPTCIRHETSQVPPASGTQNYWREWEKDALDARNGPNTFLIVY